MTEIESADRLMDLNLPERYEEIHRKDLMCVIENLFPVVRKR